MHHRILERTESVKSILSLRVQRIEVLHKKKYLNFLVVELVGYDPNVSLSVPGGRHFCAKTVSRRS